MDKAEVEERAALAVLGILGLINCLWWGIRGKPEWAKARSSYPR